MGSPAMNLIPARATPNGQGSVIEIARDGDEPLRLHEPRHAGLAGDILLGLRPEDMHEATARAGEALQGGAVRVDVVEPAGADTYVVAKLGGKEVTSRLSADTRARAGEMLEVGFDLSKASYFCARHWRATGLKPNRRGAAIGGHRRDYLGPRSAPGHPNRGFSR